MSPESVPLATPGASHRRGPSQVPGKCRCRLWAELQRSSSRLLPGTCAEYEIPFGTRGAVAARAVHGIVGRDSDAAIRSITCDLPIPRTLCSVCRTEARAAPHNIDVLYWTL